MQADSFQVGQPSRPRRLLRRQGWGQANPLQSRVLAGPGKAGMGNGMRGARLSLYPSGRVDAKEPSSPRPGTASSCSPQSSLPSRPSETAPRAASCEACLRAPHQSPCLLHALLPLAGRRPGKGLPGADAWPCHELGK